MESVSFGDLFWLTFVVAGLAAEGLHRVEVWRSRRAMGLELEVLGLGRREPSRGPLSRSR